MLKHLVCQPVSRGFTLVEVLVGMAVAGIIAMVLSGLFKAGILTFNYTVRQNYVLSSARKALSGEGERYGMVWMSQAAASVEELSESSLAVSGPDAFPITYFLNGKHLYQSQLDVEMRQARDIGAVAIEYYNLNEAGRIIESTAPESASFITAMVSMHGKGPKQKTYSFLSGAKLRNHP